MEPTARPADPELVGIITSAVAGDEYAFARIVAAYHEDMRRVCAFAIRIENAGPAFIAKVWGTATKRQRITLVCEQGWPMLPTDHYIEIEFSQVGERAGRVHGRIVRIEGSGMVIDGHFAGTSDKGVAHAVRRHHPH